jgi:2-isopropylmalate synthase
MDDSGKELTAAEIWRIFESEYAVGDDARAAVAQPVITDAPGEGVRLQANVRLGTDELHVDGCGAGPIDAFVHGLNARLAMPVCVLDYHEHSIGSGADAKAVAYLELRIGESMTLFGVGIDTNIVSASLKAIVSGVGRAIRRGVACVEPATLA